jgi:hypothetical protein
MPHVREMFRLTFAGSRVSGARAQQPATLDRYAVKNIFCFSTSRHAAPRFTPPTHTKPYSCLSAFASLCSPL